MAGDAATGSAAAAAAAALARGRQSSAAQAWPDAFAALANADRAQRLGAPDLQRLATAAYLLGRDDDYVGALERAHRAALDAGETPRAVRCAFWLGHHFLFRGETARATGWFARAQRLLDRAGQECVERGYLLVPVWLEQLDRGDYRAGYATAGEAAALGERFGDADLTWLARRPQDGSNISAFCCIRRSGVVGCGGHASPEAPPPSWRRTDLCSQ